MDILSLFEQPVNETNSNFGTPSAGFLGPDADHEHANVLLQAGVAVAANVRSCNQAAEQQSAVSDSVTEHASTAQQVLSADDEQAMHSVADASQSQRSKKRTAKRKGVTGEVTGINTQHVQRSMVSLVRLVLCAAQPETCMSTTTPTRKSSYPFAYVCGSCLIPWRRIACFVCTML